MTAGGRKPRAAIVGVGETPVGRVEACNSVELSARAAVAAINDAGLRACDIDGLMCGGSLMDGMFMYNARMANYLGIRPTYASMIPLGGAPSGTPSSRRGLPLTPGCAATCWW